MAFEPRRALIMPPREKAIKLAYKNSKNMNISRIFSKNKIHG